MVFSYRNKTAYGSNTNFFKHMTYFYKKLYICDYFTINSKAAKLEYLSPQNLVNSTTGPLLDIYTNRPIVYIYQTLAIKIFILSWDGSIRQIKNTISPKNRF